MPNRKKVVRVPASTLLQFEHELSGGKSDNGYGVSEETLDHFRIPYQRISYHERNGGDITDKLLQQLVGKTIEFGMTVMIKNKNKVSHRVVHASFLRAKDLGQKLESPPSPEEDLSIILVKEGFIDIGS